VLLCCLMTYYQRNLPHWQPEGKAIFLTWRLYGSLPEHVLVELKSRSGDAGKQFARAERFLDGAGFGPRWLTDPRIAACVEACMLRGAHQLSQYQLLAYVVMPNHVHVLVEPRTSVERITHGIKGVSARDANRILKGPGLTFWQAESFDHWVRKPAEGEKICRYIENNPVKAGLVRRAEDWKWSSAARK
jgi:REP element-mobilizing transposase RayT